MPGPRTIRLENWRGRLEVDSQLPKDEDGWIPSGKAFVGLVVPRGLEVDGGVQENAIPGRLVPVGTQQDGASTRTPETYQLTQKDYERSTAFTVRAVAFYRGRADDDGAAVVDVLPTRSPDLVKVSIARDTEAWKARYRDADPAEFRDQFANQQQRGYMHLGKGLDCVLRVKNLTPEKLNVRCAIEWSNPADPQKKDPEVIPLSLEAAGKGDDEKVLTPFFVQLDPAHPEEKRMLKVTVTALDEMAQAEDPKRKVQRNPFEVRFAQFGINEYMDISTDFIRNCKDHPAHPYCYVVNYRRMDDDKFTDPIRADEWQCEILQRSDPPKPSWIRPGLGLGFHYFDGPPNVAEYKWSGRIGPERFEGEGRNRWRPVATKP